MENPAYQRHIKSFVLRQGHLSAAQQRAMNDGLPRWGIEYRAEPLDLTDAFGRQAPKILEIGFGMGTATAEIANTCPDNDYLGVEVHSPGVGNLLS
jgi:tRNA (guanine-N7-)-methyltransferase